MKDYAQILVKRSEIARGRYHLEFEWVGSPYWPIRINWQIFESDDFKQLPWPIKEIENADEWRGTIIKTFLRTDVPWHLSWLEWKLRRGLRRLFGLIYERLIISAMVWGLAYVPEGEAPSWKHLGKKPKGF